MRPTFDLVDGAWEVTSAGALRCRARVLAVGVMQYADAELGALADGSGVGGMLVTPDSLGELRSLRSLEGAPVLIDQHLWQSPFGEQRDAAVGYVVGSPLVELPYLLADLLITDASAIDKIKTRQVTDVSSAYDAEGIAEMGEYDGQRYVGRQTQIRYNHVVLLPPGGGRGGQDVRILNIQPSLREPQEAAMADPIRVRLHNGATLHVNNEDDAKAVESLDRQAAQGAVDAASVEALSGQLDTLKASQTQAEGEVARLTGELQAVKEQLAAATAPDAIEQAAQVLVHEREDAAQVMNAQRLPDDMQTLSGHALRSEVVQRLRAHNGLPAIAAEKLADPHFVAGLYEGLRHAAPSDPVINGSRLTQPASVQNQHAMNLADNRQRFDKLYGGKAQ